MAVVAHHPVVVHTEGVRFCLLAVDVYLAVLYHEVVAFIHTNRALVYGYVVHCELKGCSTLRNPDWTVVVACPTGVAVERIDVPLCGVVDKRYALHNVLAGLQSLNRGVGQRQIAGRVKAGNVLHRDAELVDKFKGHLRLQLHVVRVLHVIGLLVGLAVGVDDVVLYLQSLSGQTHAALHVVLAAVDGSARHGAVGRRIGIDDAAAVGIQLCEEVALLLAWHLREVGQIASVLLGIGTLAQSVGKTIEVLGLILVGCAERIACGIVEYYDVVLLNCAQSLGTLIAPLWPADVRLAFEYGQRVLCQRHGEGSLWLARTVAHLRHEQIVARQ